jgi:hypothetical protein
MADEVNVSVAPFRGAPPAADEIVESLRAVLTAYDRIDALYAEHHFIVCMTATEWDDTYGRIEQARKILAQHDAVWRR